MRSFKEFCYGLLAFGLFMLVCVVYGYFTYIGKDGYAYTDDKKVEAFGQSVTTFLLCFAGGVVLLVIIVAAAVIIASGNRRERAALQRQGEAYTQFADTLTATVNRFADDRQDERRHMHDSHNRDMDRMGYIAARAIALLQEGKRIANVEGESVLLFPAGRDRDGVRLYEPRAANDYLTLDEQADMDKEQTRLLEGSGLEGRLLPAGR